MVKSLASGGELDDEFFERMYAKVKTYIGPESVINPKYTDNGNDDIAKSDPTTFGWLALKWFLAVCAVLAVMFLMMWMIR